MEHWAKNAKSGGAFRRSGAQKATVDEHLDAAKANSTWISACCENTQQTNEKKNNKNWPRTLERDDEQSRGEREKYKKN